MEDYVNIINELKDETIAAAANKTSEEIQSHGYQNIQTALDDKENLRRNVRLQKIVNARNKKLQAANEELINSADEFIKKAKKNLGN